MTEQEMTQYAQTLIDFARHNGMKDDKILNNFDKVVNTHHRVQMQMIENAATEVKKAFK